MTHAHTWMQTRTHGHTLTHWKKHTPMLHFKRTHSWALMLKLFCFHSYTMKRQTRCMYTHRHTHTNTQTVHRVIISRAVGSSLDFIMRKQSPWSVSLWTMTWWSEVLEGWVFVPAEWLLLMEDNKLERSTLKLLSFTCAASLCLLARWRMPETNLW